MQFSFRENLTISYCDENKKKQLKKNIYIELHSRAGGIKMDWETI